MENMQREASYRNESSLGNLVTRYLGDLGPILAKNLAILLKKIIFSIK
jgi:hypothetical protein